MQPVAARVAVGVLELRHRGIGAVGTLPHPVVVAALVGRPGLRFGGGRGAMRVVLQIVGDLPPAGPLVLWESLLGAAHAHVLIRSQLLPRLPPRSVYLSPRPLVLEALAVPVSAEH